MKTSMALLAGLLVVSIGYAVPVSQPITVTLQSNNQGIELVNPDNTQTVCYKSGSSVSIGYPTSFTAAQLSSKPFQACQSVSNDQAYYGIKIFGASGLTAKAFALKPGQNCQFKYHWLSGGWQETCS